MYRAYLNANNLWYVSFEDDRGFHGQPGVWTRQNQYETRQEAVKVARRKNKELEEEVIDNAKEK